MSRSKDLIKLQKLTGLDDIELAEILLGDAEEYVMTYTNRTRMIDELYPVVRELAVIKFNRLGTEGEKSRSEGGESYTFSEMPPQIHTVLDRYRLCRIGGKSFEAPKKQN